MKKHLGHVHPLIFVSSKISGETTFSTFTSTNFPVNHTISL